MASALAIVLVIAMGGCAQSPESSSAPPPAADDPGLIHVHELAVEPASGVIYAATHTGLFKLSGAAATRVGEHFHDLMGFTITSEGEFLGSGHPDLRSSELEVEGKPPLLGMVDSPDRGATWQSVSLLGDVDFHALEVTPEKIYGADATSGRFLVSKDGGRTWSSRSRPGLHTFAVAPGEPDLLVGVGESGPVRSANGGRTWLPMKTPPLALVAWEGKELIGAGPDGSIVVSDDAGETWSRRGSLPGAPEALHADGNMILASATEVGILQSSDAGRTWDVIYSLDQAPTAPSG